MCPQRRPAPCSRSILTSVRRCPPDEFADARAVLRIPIVDVPEGALDLDTLLDSRGAFAALIVEGALLREDTASDRVALQILGPGDVVGPVAATRWTAVDSGRIGLLDTATLVGVHEWPQLAAGLVLRLTSQLDRAARQLAICQLSTVDQRVVATMWDLAARWGRVSPAGTSVPLQLTHGVLGQLVGAKRPTVSLALTELAASGDLVRRPDRTWLLSGSPPAAIAAGARQTPSVGRIRVERSLTRDRTTSEALEVLRATVEDLHDGFGRRRDRLALDRVRYASTRAASVGLRARSLALRKQTPRPRELVD
jgi:CRP/FNR family transcriptional regulator, cyclic AMP receptor protein